MKVSRIITLCLLIPLCGTAVLAVYLNAQERIVPKIGNTVIPKPVLEDEPDPNVVIRKSEKRATPKPVLDVVPPGPNLDSPIEIESDQPLLPTNRAHSRVVPDPAAVQLFTEEQAADQEAQRLAAQCVQAPTEEKSAEFKKKLREKLVAIFAMQQNRRIAEIASIEARLARLKSISNKRETNKDAIVDRRLEQMTGGVDELGWEESNRGAIRFSVPALGPKYFPPDLNGGDSLDYGNPVPVRGSDNNVPATEPVPVAPKAK